MEFDKLEKASGPEALADYLASQPQPMHHEHGGDGSVETVREDEYEGHHISIQTTYRIEVDGEILLAPLGVDNDGNLHCHALPNYQFTSAVGLVRSLIDNFPEDFKKKRSSKKSAGKKSASKKSAKKSAGGHDHASHKHAAKGGK
ncbi:MAG TPA: hypothetical protein VJT09_04200 [Pyrinomonadaceae bacterium]|nr:hypothetical protein [Pyrinomonadaceae bacterium]